MDTNACKLCKRRKQGLIKNNLRGWHGHIAIISRMDREAEIRKKWLIVKSEMSEREIRLWAAMEAKAIGSGGISLVSRTTGLAISTIRRGLKDLSEKDETFSKGRSRKPGGGRKRLVEAQVGLLKALDDLVDPDTRGDPTSPLRWCSKSTAKLAEALKKKGYRISPQTVALALKRAGYTLQRTRKTKEGIGRPGRDWQFRRISELVKEYQLDGQPVVSVDTKKKELIGNFANAGVEWQPEGQPEEVDTHDFPDKKLGKAIPYGIYDIARNEGYVSVGVTHDTPEFAVAALRRWWAEVGQPTYPKATKLLITADCGGSNGYRARAWKSELYRFAADSGLSVRVAHFPPGTSKWNKIEHRLFCHITHNWRGRVLVSREVVVSLIGNTTTTKGLRVRAALDNHEYKTGIRISDEEFAAVLIKHDDSYSDWNYTIGT